MYVKGSNGVIVFDPEVIAVRELAPYGTELFFGVVVTKRGRDYLLASYRDEGLAAQNAMVIADAVIDGRPVSL